MLRSPGFSGGEGMSNATLLLESLALIKDAYDWLGKVDHDMSASDALYVVGARLLLTAAHAQLEDLLHKLPGGEA